MGSFCTLVNILHDTATAGVMLRIIPRSLRHLYSAMVWAVFGIASSDDCTLAYILGERRSNWVMASRFQPITFFWVEHAPPPCPTFLRDMSSLLSVSVALLGRNTLSI